MFLNVAVLVLLSTTCMCLDIGTFHKYLRENNSSISSPECEQQKAIFLEGLKNGDAWTIKMLDAYGRIPEGLTQGNSLDLGMYDQCLNIFEELETVDIQGKYCYGGLIIPAIELNRDSLQINEMIKKQAIASMDSKTELKKRDSEVSVASVLLLAACVPDACLPSDLFGELGNDLICQMKNETRKLNAADAACLSFFVIVACLVIGSTVYDVYLQKIRRGPKHKILLAFSVYTNGEKIIKTNLENGQILFFNGMKVLSMFWVIMGHRYGSLGSLAVNAEETEAWKRKWFAIYVLLAPLAVDTFLFISGSLLAYTFLKTMSKPNHKFNILVYYLHRYIRLTPALAVLYFFRLTLARRIQDGPLIPLVDEYFSSRCTNANSWSFFLYVQNYVASDNLCMIHTWYLSVEMQLYIISPLLLLPMLYFGKRITYMVLPAIVVISIISTMLIYHFSDIALWSDYSYATHVRFSPWLIGLIFGAFCLDYQANKERYQIENKLVVLSIWGAILSLTAFLFFFQDDATYNQTKIKSTLYFPLQKPLWALCLFWISFACLSGNGGLLNTFLSIPAFQILSKITYSTYLIHLTVLTLSTASARTLPYFTDYDGIRVVIADICISYAAGALWTLAFESPILVIEKIVFRHSSKKRM